jgi:hypothetical protein
MELTQEMIDRYYDAGHSDRYETICALMNIPYPDFVAANYDDFHPVRKAVLDMEVKLWISMPSDKEAE